jgi:5'-nucleotidase/UDP-sugar diphosphatase
MMLSRKTWIFLVCSFFIILCISTVYSQQQEIRILHLNDFHGFAVEYRPYGSSEMQGRLAYLAWKVDKLRSEKSSLLLAAGDMIQGNNWANLFQGKSVIEAMNEMGFDAMVVGNHEFDYGQDVLRERIAEANFPVLGANVKGVSELKQYIIKELEGVRIAVIGVVTDEVPVTTHPRNVVGLEFLPPADRVQKIVWDLRSRCDIIVVLSHLGFAGDMELAKKVNGIDLIVGGHSHTKLEKPVFVGMTTIVQAYEHGKALGVVKVTVEDRQIAGITSFLEPILPDPKVMNKTVAVIVNNYQKKVDARMNETVGVAEVDLDGKNARLGETNLGNLLADIMRGASGADTAIINGGGIRTSINKGQVKVNDVYSVVPFDNYIVAIKLSGKQVQETLEHGVSGIEEEEGRFPQVSGLIFTYDRKAPKGSRVKEILIAGQLLVPEKDYTVATNDFLAAGGDGYKAFGDALKSSKDYSVMGGTIKAEKLVYNDSGRWLRDVIIDYIKEQKTISPKVEGRIREVR